MLAACCASAGMLGMAVAALVPCTLAHVGGRRRLHCGQVYMLLPKRQSDTHSVLRAVLGLLSALQAAHLQLHRPGHQPGRGGQPQVRAALAAVAAAAGVYSIRARVYFTRASSGLMPLPQDLTQRFVHACSCHPFRFPRRHMISTFEQAIRLMPDPAACPPGSRPVESWCWVMVRAGRRAVAGCQMGRHAVGHGASQPARGSAFGTLSSRVADPVVLRRRPFARHLVASFVAHSCLTSCCFPCCSLLSPRTSTPSPPAAISFWA